MSRRRSGAGALAAGYAAAGVSPIDRNRWGVVVAYATLGAATQVLWLTYAPITTATAAHYGVSEGAVGWLAEIFPLLYVVLAIPAGMALDRRFVPVLRAGAVLTAAGALLRLGGDAFAWALAGQLLVAIAQPFVLNAVTKLASEYVAPAARPAAISLGTGGTFVGLLLGLLLGPALGSAANLRPLLLTEAAFAVAAATALWVALRSRPAGAASLERAIGLRELRSVWDDRFVRTLCALAFVGFGVFIALTTWLQGLLEPFGVSDEHGGRDARRGGRCGRRDDDAGCPRRRPAAAPSGRCSPPRCSSPPSAAPRSPACGRRARSSCSSRRSAQSCCQRCRCCWSWPSAAPGRPAPRRRRCCGWPATSAGSRLRSRSARSSITRRRRSACSRSRRRAGLPLAWRLRAPSGELALGGAR